MSHADYEYCLSLQDTTCPLLATVHDLSQLSCAGALFLGYHDKIKKLCEFDVYPNAKFPPYVEYVNQGIYLVASPSFTYQILCPDKARSPQNGYLSLVTLPCACEIQTPEIKIPASLALCDEMTTEIQLNYPLNAAQLQLLDVNDFDLDNSVPSLPSLKADMMNKDIDLKSYLEKDHKFSVNLDKKTLSLRGKSYDLLKPRPLSSYDSYIDWNDICIKLATALSVFNICVMVGIATFLYIKWKTIVPLLLLLKQNTVNLPMAEAQEIKITHSVYDSSILTAELIMLCLFLVLGICYYYKFNSHAKSRNQSPVESVSSKATIVLSDSKEHVELTLFTVQACLSHIKMITLPSVHEVKIRFSVFRNPNLYIKWESPFRYQYQKVYFEVNTEVNKEITRQLGMTVQSFLYDFKQGPERLFSTFRMKCSCPCGTHKQILYDVTQRQTFTYVHDATSQSQVDNVSDNLEDSCSELPQEIIVK